MEPTDPNHYAVLGVERNATSAEITTAYRKKALKCHPDKDRDNPSAARSFHQISESLKVLTDPVSRATLDKLLDERIAKELRKKKLHGEEFCCSVECIFDIRADRRWVYEEMDAMERADAARRVAAEQLRKQFKVELEARENAALLVVAQQRKAADELERKKENMRRAGRKYQAEQVRMKCQEERDRQQRQDFRTVPNPGVIADDITLDHDLILRLKWRSKKSDPGNGGYSADVIKYLFSAYGEVSEVIVSSRRKGSAIVEFTTESAATDAFRRERGLPSNPLIVSRSSPEKVNSASAPRNADVENNSPTTKETSSQKITPGEILNEFENMKV